jgi:hypothetical protein
MPRKARRPRCGVLKCFGWATPRPATRRVPTPNLLTNRQYRTELHQLNSRFGASKRADPLDSLRLARLNGVQQDRHTRHNERYLLKNAGIRPRTHSPLFDVSTTASRHDRRVGGSWLHFLTHLLDSVHYPARWERDHVHYRGGGRLPFCSGMHFHSVLFRTLGPVSKLEADRQMIPLSNKPTAPNPAIASQLLWGLIGAVSVSRNVRRKQ